ncbi:MAG: hypothetical protein BKP49_02290 [Treponema sp. CETP13]|nr:MAG: hypothetical protein BKP49_02290 [Treponema sp. CETP13]
MKLSKIAKKLQLQIITPSVLSDVPDSEITTIYTGDLLSDIMGNAPDECLIVTIQAHKNTVAVATLKDSPAIIICNNRQISEEMKLAATSEKIIIFKTDKNQYEISGLLYTLLNRNQ